MTEITKSTEAKKDEMQVEKEKLESVKRADAAVKTMHDFTSPEVLYKELINSVLKYHPSTDISLIPPKVLAYIQEHHLYEED